jgi:hypothetical protein
VFALAVLAIGAARQAEADPADAPQSLLADRRLDIAFLRGHFPHGSEVWLRESGGERERLLMRVQGEIYDFRWVSGGAELLLHVDRAPAYRLLRRDGRVEPVDEAGIQCSSSPVAGRDGAMLACSDTQISVIRNGKPRTLVTEPENVFITDVELSPDGKRVAYVALSSVEPAPYYLNVIGTTTPRRRSLTTRAPSELMDKGEISWSSDSRRVAYGVFRPDGFDFVDLLPRWLRKQREAVMVLDVRARPVVRFVPGARPDWSRNGTRIAFDRKSGARRELYVAGANGKQLRRLTGGLRDSWRPRWRR